jgi:diketogulonate reductase-like aldo/keto reductase
MEYRTLSNGVRIPPIGLGTWPMKGKQVIDAIVYADSIMHGGGGGVVYRNINSSYLW